MVIHLDDEDQDYLGSLLKKAKKVTKELKTSTLDEYAVTEAVALYRELAAKLTALQHRAKLTK